MIRIVCDNCGRTLVENDKTLNDWRELHVEFIRNQVTEVKTYHLCAEQCVQNFKEVLDKFMSE